MDYILLTKMQFHAFHGVTEQENKVGNTFYVDLKIGCDFTKACISDNIEDTINYADVFSMVDKIMKNPCKLIEHLAENICSELKSRFSQIKSIEIKVTKLNPPISGQLDSASIILER